MFLSSMLLLCIGTFGLAEEKKPGPVQPPTIEEQIEHLDGWIRRNEQRAMNTKDPQQLERYRKIVRNLEIVKSKKLMIAKGNTLSKEDRKEMKEAYKTFQELRSEAQEVHNANKTESPSAKKEPRKEVRAARRKSSGRDTYETGSGFKVRLKMPE